MATLDPSSADQEEGIKNLLTMMASIHTSAKVGRGQAWK
jgi:hypothetical protein